MQCSFELQVETEIFYSYLVDGACPFIVMDMAVKCNVYLVLLPKFLQAFPSHRLFKCTPLTIPFVRRITKDTMSCKDQPRLLLSIHRCKTILDELVLLCSLPPVMFCVSYTKVKHSVICRIPVHLSKKLTKILGNTSLKQKTLIFRIQQRKQGSY